MTCDCKGNTVSGVSGAGATSGNSRPPRNENQGRKIVIEFSALPPEARTKEIREFYDRDGSGFLESCNAEGQDEIALMQHALGVDLSTYKSDIARTVITDCNHEGTRQMTRAYDAQGRWVKDLEICDACVATYERTMSQTKFSKVYLAEDYSLKLEQTINSRGWADDSTYYFENGNILYTDYKNGERTLKDKDGNILATEILDDNDVKKVKQTIYQHKSLTDGKHQLAAKYTYMGETTDFDQHLRYNYQTPLRIPDEYKVTETSYTLNGKPVQAKSIGKGRWEITDENGKVSYISHDGKHLKPEYVRKNP